MYVGGKETSNCGIGKAKAQHCYCDSTGATYVQCRSSPPSPAFPAAGMFVTHMVVAFIILATPMRRVEVSRVNFMKDCCFFLGAVVGLLAVLLRGRVDRWQVSDLVHHRVVAGWRCLVLTSGKTVAFFLERWWACWRSCCVAVLTSGRSVTFFKKSDGKRPYCSSPRWWWGWCCCRKV